MSLAKKTLSRRNGHNSKLWSIHLFPISDHSSLKNLNVKSIRAYSRGQQEGSNFCVIHFLSYSPIFKENYTHVLCHTHCVIHFFTAIFSVILHVGTKEPIKSSYKALTLLSELLISGYVGKEKPKIRRAFRRKPKRTH